MSRTPPRAHTETGRYEGVRCSGVSVFKGIRYAAPPVGELRWAPPAPPEKLAGVETAAEFGPACPQPPGWDAPYRAGALVAGLDPGAVAMEAGPTGEDCLSLNVWTPRVDDQRRPVLVWIHGGASAYGSAAAAFFDGTRLAAEHDLVVVTINYRLGALGFLAHRDLVAESPLSTAGNYGFLDQVRSLEWVRDNISEFGGDPRQVTVIGESAGGRAVFELLAHPPAEGLFQRAIAQSAWEEIHHARRLGEPPFGSPSRLSGGVEEALELARRFAVELGFGGARVVERMRAVPAQEIVEAASALGNPALVWGPIVDGVVFSDHPLALMARGETRAVPLLAGFNADEGSIFFLDEGLPLLEPVRYRSYVRSLFPRTSDEILELYPASEDETEAHRSLSRLYGDRVFVLPSVVAARCLYDRVPVHLYRFTHVHPQFSADGPGGRRVVGCFHGSEIPFVFGTAPAPLNGVDENLGATMRALWASFARSGTPDEHGLADAPPPWPRYEPEKAAYLELGDRIETRTGLLADRLGLLTEELERRIFV